MTPHPDAARRVRILVIDGLGWEAFSSITDEVPELRALAAEGVSRPLLAGFPSFTYPSITTMATGRAPREHGVRVNGPRPPPAWDSVSKTAAAARIPVRVASGSFRNFASLLLLPPESEHSSLEAILANPAERELDWLYFGAVDAAGHQHGGDSPEYAAAVRDAGKVLGQIRAATNPETDALVVVSDHGHLPGGGHGGAEPEVRVAVFLAMGRGITPATESNGGATLPPAPMRNLAATLAALLGLPPPADATGRAMGDVLGHSPPIEDGSDAEEETAARSEFAARAMRRLGMEAIAVALAAAFALRALARAGSAVTVRDALPALVFSALFLGGYFGLGYRITWSVPRSQLVYQVATGLLALAAVMVSFTVVRPERKVQEAAAVALVLGGAYALSVGWIGIDPREMAGPFASFFFLIVVTMLFYAGLVFGVRALPPMPAGWRGWAGRIGLAGILGFLFVAPFLLRFR